MAGKVPFRELVRYAIGGGWGTDEPTADSLPVRVIRGTDFANIASGAFDEIPRRFEVRAKAERRLLQANDIVLEISGGSRTSNQTTGRTLFVTQTTLDRFEEPVIPASFCRLVRVRDDVVVPRYAYFALQEMYNSGRAALYEHHSTGISNFQFEYFLDQELVWLPPLPEQRAIAHILGTLDDKIELNRRMSQTLEAMARALFKAWFVDFEPVRAKMEGRWQRGQSLPGLPAHLYDLFPDRLVDSELGEIPEGWSVGRLGEYIENFDSKRVPLSSREREKLRGIYPYYGAAGVVDYVNDYLFDDIYVLVGEDGSVVTESGHAITQYVWGKFWVNNHAHVLQGRHPVSTEQLYLYFAFESVAPYVTGAVQPKLSQGRMNTMPFLFAGEKVCLEFQRLIEPWFTTYRKRSGESRTLAALRDALLPKLISGEIRVKDAERFLKERGL